MIETRDAEATDPLAAYPMVTRTRTLTIGGRQWQITAVENEELLMPVSAIERT